MRDIQELLKTQVISPTTNNTSSSISHALHLHEELQQLKKENESLKEENKKMAERNQSLIDGQGTYTDLIADLEKDLKSADEKHAEQQRKLQDQLKTLQLAWDSLYDDLDKVKKERDGLRTKLDEVVRKGDGTVDDDNDDQDSTKDLRDTLNASLVSPRTPNTPRRSKSLRPSMLSNLSLMQSPMPEESPAPDIEVDQAALLRNSLQRQHSSSSLFASAAFHMFHSGQGDHDDNDDKDDDDDRSVSSGIASIVSAPFRSLVSGSVSGTEKKINDLECENLKLRSTIVRLQAQFRDEKYLNSHSSDKNTTSYGDDGLLVSPSSSNSSSKLRSTRRTMSLQTRSGTRRGIPARTTPRSTSLVEGGLRKLNDQVPLVVTTTVDAAEEADQVSESSSSSSPSTEKATGNENETRSQTSKDQDRESSSTSVTDSVSSCSEGGVGEQLAIDIPPTTNMDSTTVQ